MFFKPKVRKEDKFNGLIGGPGTYIGRLFSYISDLRRTKAYILIFLKKFGGPRSPFWPKMAPPLHNILGLTFIYLVLINYVPMPTSKFQAPTDIFPKNSSSNSWWFACNFDYDIDTAHNTSFLFFSFFW